MLLPSGRRTARSRETMPPRHRFLEPIHNVKEGANPHVRMGLPIRKSGLHTWRIFAPFPRKYASKYAKWWSQPGSNRRPQACKASALPTELWPLLRSPLASFGGQAHWCSKRLGLPDEAPKERSLVGRVGVEPTTSRLSGVRSNHLSYRPPMPSRTD